MRGSHGSCSHSHCSCSQENQENQERQETGINIGAGGTKGTRARAGDGVHRRATAEQAVARIDMHGLVQE